MVKSAIKTVKEHLSLTRTPRVSHRHINHLGCRPVSTTDQELPDPWNERLIHRFPIPSPLGYSLSSTNWHPIHALVWKPGLGSPTRPSRRRLQSSERRQTSTILVVCRWASATPLDVIVTRWKPRNISARGMKVHTADYFQEIRGQPTCIAKRTNGWESWVALQ